MRNSDRMLWPWYVLGGLGLTLMLAGAIQAALTIWQGLFLVAIPFMVLSAAGWFLYKYAELTATGGRSERSPISPGSSTRS